MRYTAIWGTVAATELAAHFLSLGWSMMFLLAAFAWTAMSGAAVASTARSTKSRVDAIVPVLGQAHTLATNAFPKTGGTVSGSMTVTGSHTVAGQVNANTVSVSGDATTGGDHTVHGSMHSDNNVSASGQVSAGSGSFGPVSAGAYSGASIHVSGSSQTDGNHTVGGQANAGSFSGGSIHVSGNAQSDGTFTAGGDVNAGGTVRGAVHASSAVVDTMSAVASPAANVTALKQAVDGILNRL